MSFESELRRRFEERSRRAGAPKYIQLTEVIEEMVNDGSLSDGDQLPAESYLSTIVSLSLGTVQKSMSILRAHGIVLREHGRGTFVARDSAALRDIWHFRFLNEDRTSILPVFPTLVSVEVAQDDGPWHDFLANGKKYVKILRALNVNNSFMAASTIYVEYDKFHPLLSYPEEKLNLHLRDVMREDFGLATARIMGQVGCHPLSDDICKLMNLENHSLGLVCELLGYDFRGAPVSFQIIYAPPHAPMLEVRERTP
jgi:GntR family transcriptional regulator